MDHGAILNSMRVELSEKIILDEELWNHLLMNRIVTRFNKEDIMVSSCFRRG